jgi:hypothetical protein
MHLSKSTFRSWPIDRVCPAVLYGLLLATADYLMDIVMDWFGTSASKTVLNGAAIGILGGAAAFFYLKVRCQNCDFATSKERLNLIGDLNRGIRGALGALAQSALSEDRSARLKGIDEATDRIDTFLCSLTITSKSTNGALCLLLKEKKLPEARAVEASSRADVMAYTKMRGADARCSSNVLVEKR